MDFQVLALDVGQFSHLFGKSDRELTEFGATRVTADRVPGFPCRVSLEDADCGESLLLLNYEHQPATTPYRSCHAIFVREWAKTAKPGKNEIPAVLSRRILSVRGFDDADMMIDATVVEGAILESAIHNLLANDLVAYLHVHNAARGCYAATIERCPNSEIRQ
jgi:hypothetical protein